MPETFERQCRVFLIKAPTDGRGFRVFRTSLIRNVANRSYDLVENHHFGSARPPALDAVLHFDRSPSPFCLKINKLPNRNLGGPFGMAVALHCNDINLRNSGFIGCKTVCGPVCDEVDREREIHSKLRSLNSGAGGRGVRQRTGSNYAGRRRAL